MQKRTILKNKFFNRPVLEVAPELLGKYLVRRFPRGKISAYMITETEAYDGEKDLANHAKNGRTERTEIMYGEAGHWYVYLCYGMHFMLNIVTGPKDYPAAVLIRGLSKLDGPGIITQELAIKKDMNGKISLPEYGLWIEDRGMKIPKKNIVRTSRIGVEYAGKWAKKPYRFVFCASKDMVVK